MILDFGIFPRDSLLWKRWCLFISTFQYQYATIYLLNPMYNRFVAQVWGFHQHSRLHSSLERIQGYEKRIEKRTVSTGGDIKAHGKPLPNEKPMKSSLWPLAFCWVNLFSSDWFVSLNMTWCSWIPNLLFGRHFLLECKRIIRVMGLAHRVFQVQEVKFASERFGLSDFNIPPGMCLKPSKIRVDIHYLFPQLVVYRISSAINSRTLVPQFFANHISLWGFEVDKSQVLQISRCFLGCKPPVEFRWTSEGNLLWGQRWWKHWGHGGWRKKSGIRLLQLW